MTKYYQPKLTDAQHSFVLLAMTAYYPDIEDNPKAEKMWLKTWDKLQSSGEIK
jgi:hypothetical protein